MQNVIESLDDLVWDPTLCPDELKKRVYRVFGQTVLFTWSAFVSLKKIQHWACENEDIYKNKRTQVSRIIRLNSYNHCDMNDKLHQHYTRIENNYGVIRLVASVLLMP